LFYEIALSNFKNKIATKNNYSEIKLKKNQFELTNTDWTSFYNDLNAEIKFRYYLPQAMSPAKSTLWMEAF